MRGAAVTDDRTIAEAATPCEATCDGVVNEF